MTTIVMNKIRKEDQTQSDRLHMAPLCTQNSFRVWRSPRFRAIYDKVYWQYICCHHSKDHW